MGLDWAKLRHLLQLSPARKANVAPPDNWDEMIKAEPAMKAAASSLSHWSGTLLTPWPTSSGPTLVTQATNDPTLLLKIDMQEDGKKWTDEGVVAALAKFQSLVKAGAFGDGLLAQTYPIGQNLFTTGKTALLWDADGCPKAWPLYRTSSTP